MSGECDFDHSFNGTENEIGLRPGEQGPQPPIQTKGPEHEKEIKRLEKLMKARDAVVLHERRNA